MVMILAPLIVYILTSFTDGGPSLNDSHHKTVEEGGGGDYDLHLDPCEIVNTITFN